MRLAVRLRKLHHGIVDLVIDEAQLDRTAALLLGFDDAHLDQLEKPMNEAMTKPARGFVAEQRRELSRSSCREPCDHRRTASPRCNSSPSSTCGLRTADALEHATHASNRSAELDRSGTAVSSLSSRSGGEGGGETRRGRAAHGRAAASAASR
jgi:hypothetical protein